MELWLIMEHVFAAIMGAMLGPDAARLSSEYRPGEKEGYVRRGKEAVHTITGTLTKNPSWYSSLFGGGNTTYGEINRNLLAADSDPDVKAHKIYMDSPGGAVAGLFETLDVIKALTKPISTIVTGTCASAAYAIASQTARIEALNASCVIGSIGVMTQVATDTGVVTLTSSGAPNKAPDVGTDEGRKAIIARLDESEELFVNAVAEGRRTTRDKVLADFGRGGVFLAKKALTAGMIDGILSASYSGGSKSNITKTEERSMDLNELKAQHPAVYAAAVADGVEQERNRVSAHVLLGEASGAVQAALKNIKEGKACDQFCQAEYTAAKLAALQLSSRAQESNEAGAAATGSTPPPAKDMGDSVAELLEGGF